MRLILLFALFFVACGDPVSEATEPAPSEAVDTETKHWFSTDEEALAYHREHPAENIWVGDPATGEGYKFEPDPDKKK